MGLRAEVVDLVGLELVEQPHEAAGVGEVAVVQEELDAALVRVAVEVVDPVGVEGRGAADDAVDLVALVEQQLGEVGAVLAGDAGDEGLGGPVAVPEPAYTVLSCRDRAGTRAAG